MMLLPDPVTDSFSEADTLVDTLFLNIWWSRDQSTHVVRETKEAIQTAIQPAQLLSH